MEQANTDTDDVVVSPEILAALNEYEISIEELIEFALPNNGEGDEVEDWELQDVSLVNDTRLMDEIAKFLLRTRFNAGNRDSGASFLEFIRVGSLEIPQREVIAQSIKGMQSNYDECIHPLSD